MTFLKGKTPWNKGLKTGIITPGIFQKGHIPYNRDLSKETLAAKGQNYGSWRRGVSHTEETRNKIANANRGHKPSSEAKHKTSMKLKGRPPSKETRAASSKSLLKRWRDPQQREKFIQNMRELALRQWADPQYRNRQMEILISSRHQRPNKPETKLQHLLNQNYPGEWEYTGDGSHTIGGLSVDFTNVNGEKAVIELFGDYWHNRPDQKWHQSELGRIMACNALGFECLVIWEHELKDEQAVIAKIKNFTANSKEQPCKASK